jgi:hypothetical protein
MKKRYKRRPVTIEAVQLRPDLHGELPEGVHETATPGKFWLRTVRKDPKTQRPEVGGQVAMPFDYIVWKDGDSFVLSKKDFEELYEEA